MASGKKSIFIAAAGLLLIILCACRTPEAPVSTTGEVVIPPSTPACMLPPTELSDNEAQLPTALYPRTMIDQAGRTVVIEELPNRIISGYYISSSVCMALDIADRLVGIEANAETRPVYALARPELLELPNVGTARDFNLEACLALKPDLVILPYRLRDVAETMDEMGVPVILVNPESYAEMIGMLELIGAATGADERANRLIEWIEDINSELWITKVYSYRPDVFISGLNNWLTTVSSDMYQAELITMAGGHNVASYIAGGGWTEISYEQLLVMDPDYIIIPSEAGYDVSDVLYDPMLAELRAVVNNSVYKMPSAIEAWDSPIPASMLGARALVREFRGILYRSEANYVQAIEGYYEEFYGFSVRDSVSDWQSVLRLLS